MSSAFIEKSKNIANNYIQNVVFLDDRAYQDKNAGNPDHDFNSYEITKIFAAQNKICAVYRPESEIDINHFKLTAQKADIVILDWQITLVNPAKIENPEEDAETEDPRGQYTKDIIRSLSTGGESNSVKLVLVYTGDYTILENITQEIFDEIFAGGEYTIDTEELCIRSESTKILVRAKEVEIKQEENRQRYEDKILPYREIPSFLLEQFTEISAGLLSNFALLSLTAIRRNSGKILALYNKKLDPAYLGHKSVLPYQNDAEELLIELFGSTLVDLLKFKHIGKWLNDNLIANYLDEKENINVGHFERTSEFLKGLVTSEIIDEKERFSQLISKNFATKQHAISKSTILNYIKKSTILFKDKLEDDYEEIDKRFAILTHHKNVFLTGRSAPKLSLGTLVKSTLHDRYFLCIQQRCDSVRITEAQERKFLFLPLDVNDTKFNFITTEGVKLYHGKKSYNLRTLKFLPNEAGSVYGVLTGDDYVFTQVYASETDEQFIWKMELKDLHAQRIVADYASELSRVGLDESEWLRRSFS